jgi:predicted nucleotidyltransferase
MMIEIASAVRTVAHELPGMLAVYLFGSFAEEREHRESDVDLGILLDRAVYPSERERFEFRVVAGSRLSDLLGRPADVVILNDAPPELARAIVKGKRIHCADEEADHAFVRDAQLRAADIAPFLRRMREIKLAAGERK